MHTTRRHNLQFLPSHERKSPSSWFSCALITVVTLSAPAFVQATDPSDTLRIKSCRPGFEQVFKTGYWTPVTIELSGGIPGSDVEVELMAPDDDGVATVVRAAVTIGSDGHAITRLHTKIGRIGATLTVNLRVDGEVVRSRGFTAGETVGPAGIPQGMPANTELVLHLGTAELDLETALRVQDADAPSATRQVVRSIDFEQFPAESIGYDSVNWLVISTSDPSPFEGLDADHPQIVAIGKWVELGGRLLIVCGRSADELLTTGRPLGGLVPGEFQEIVTTDPSLAIEQFSGTSESVASRGESFLLSVPRLNNVTGRVEAYEDSLPIVVRTPRGFGQIVFVGVDLDAAPFAGWNGRPNVLRRLMQIAEPASDARGTTARTLTTRGYDDLAGALRNRLGNTFLGVSVVPFGLITVMVLAYLALIGPVDYYIVKRLLGRMEWTWITFPAMIVLVSWGAFSFAHAKKGDSQRLNQAELVDFDYTSGIARGNVWACLYSPAATTYDVSLVPRWPGGTSVESPQMRLSWFGMPGKGLGGMGSANTLPSETGVSYRYQSGLSELVGLPVETWSTKSLAAQWTAEAPRLVDAELTATDDGLVVGSVRNDSQAKLTDARLLYGNWGWRLGDLPPGSTVTIDNNLDPLKVRTLMTRGLRDTSGSADTGRGVFVPEQAQVGELLDVMMFYDATGGRRFSRLANQYQPHCDLSHLLDLGRAILLARCDEAGSEFRDGESSLSGDAHQRWTVYRFVIPVTAE